MKLVKILPDKIQIKTDDVEFRNVRLNSLISVSDGEAELITMITAITDNDVETQMDDNAIMEELQQPSLKVIECSILGSVINGEFKQQLDKYPNMGVHIKKIEDHEIYTMLYPDVSRNINSGFCIGDYAGHTTSAWIDGNKFFQRHSCIVGNTGCGKSETVTKILEETAALPGTNIVIFDIHSEYNGLSYADSIKMGDVPFPIWMLGFTDMAANVLKVKEESTVVMSALRKAYYEQQPNGNEGKPVYFSFSDMVSYMESLNNEIITTGFTKEGAAKTSKGEYNGKLAGVINTMKNMISDKRYSFLFDELLEDKEYFSNFINRIMGGSRPVKNIDLSGIPHDIAVLIIGAITKLIYNIQIIQKNAAPITLVCDEAHVYIPADFQLSAAQRRMVEIFGNIAKEGRKFGITLFVASQRPSELNKTIMAQCANYIVMKLNNENDKAMIKGIMPAGSSDIIETTAMFSPGDCLIIGDSCPMPLKIHVETARERPQSKTIDFWSEWQKEREDVDYDTCLKEYLEN